MAITMLQALSKQRLYLDIILNNTRGVSGLVLEVGSVLVHYPLSLLKVDKIMVMLTLLYL